MLEKAYNPQGTEDPTPPRGATPGEPLPKAYDARSVEDRIYAMWEQSHAFEPNPKAEETFTISLPPPNATGQLHLGHAVMLAIEDILIRFARMQGKAALWVPGTDHAAIATESVVIKKIQKEEKIPDPRAKLGREEVLRRIAEFVEGSQGTIRSQMRKMGASCDWSRERYTMDPVLNRCVNEVFVKMYKDGLIYRGHRIVNWDPKMQTTVSDDEIEYKDETVPFYTFQYGPFQISTARPETKFGDKYVVMHPDDERYKAYKHGDTFTAEWINGPVTATVIKDKAVDPEFGTGVMTITPWHDPIDFEIAERHKLEKEQIIGFDGKLLSIAGAFEGLRIEDARPKIVEKLQEKGLLVKAEENYMHRLATSYRGGGVIEPQIKEQWFIDVNKKVVQWKRREMSLKEIMQEVVKTKLITIIPDRFEKTYFQWVDNLRDWCISRQIWWGHRIPVWYRSDRGSLETYVGVRPPWEGDPSRRSLGGAQAESDEAGWEQDPDTLDTWFSSAMWTWSTLVDPALAEEYDLSLRDILLKSPDFLRFHPTSVMETGYDILGFWVTRMILMTTYVTGSIPELEYGQVPFETVYLHGMVRTREGKKMSKSHPETMIDPLDIIPKYGADALRLSMIVGQSPGADSKLYEEKIAGYRNFINKLWNASRFVLMECEKAGIDPHTVTESQLKSVADKALFHELQSVIADIHDALEHYRLSEAGERIYSFVWNYFCDWYLELSKGEPNPESLVLFLQSILAVLHPYCPFVTEEIWSHVKPHDAGLLMAQQWPKAHENEYGTEHAQLQTVIDVITAIRKLRTDQGIEPGKEVSVTLVTTEQTAILESQESHIRRLAKVGSLTITGEKPASKEVSTEFLASVEVYLSLEGLVDLEKEKANLEKEQEQLQKFLEGAKRKLSDETFVSKAPEKVVQAERDKVQTLEEKLQKIEDRMKRLA